jgi:hypothetical protein
MWARTLQRVNSHPERSEIVPRTVSRSRRIAISVRDRRLILRSHSLLSINLERKLRNKIQQRPPPHLLCRRPPTIDKRVLRTRLPGRRNHPAAKRSSIQGPLWTQMLLAAIIGHQIPDERMPRPPPQPLAFALVVANFIPQLRIPKGRQTIRRNKLSFSRSEPLRISRPPIVPLVWHSPRLVNPRRKHPLHVSFRSCQRFSQIDHLPLSSRRSDQLPVPPHVLPRNPSRLPVPRPLQLHHQRSFILGLLVTFSRRIRKLPPRCLSGNLSRTLCKILRRLVTLSPTGPRHHQHTRRR